MKHKGIYTACLVMLLTAFVQAQPIPLPDPLPQIDFAFSPAVPTSAGPVTLRLSGLWPNNCEPEQANVFVNGSTIEVRLLLPGAIDCDEPECDPILSAYEVIADVGPLASGTYSVFARIVTCEQTSDPEPVGSFTVGIPTGEPNEPNEPGEPNEVAPGTCVVLLENMVVDSNYVLPAGQAGIVVCCDTADCSGRLLVSWFLFTNGVGTSEDCNDSNTPRAIPPASGTWVDPARVGLGVCFDQCGILRQNEQECFVLETDDGQTFILVAGSWLPGFIGPDAEFELGDRVRVQGLIDIRRWEGSFFACTEEDGDIFNPVITPCAPSGGGNGEGCCAAGYEPGDRVRLLVNNPPDMAGRPSTGLPAGTLGTVLCCNADDDDFTVYVSWDNFTGGFNMSFLCDTTPIAHRANSAWWVDCDDIVLLSGGGNGNGNGNGQQCPQDNLSISFGDSGIRIVRDPTCPTTPRTFSGCANATVTANFRARLSLDIDPLPGIGGVWSGTITPNVVPAGQSSVLVCITGSAVNLANIPAGQSVRVAEAAILAVPE